jgi:hypothetical protein
LDEFDQMLLDTIDKAFKFSLGEENAKIIFEYLDKKSCSTTEIPQKLPLFSLELRKVMGSEDGQIGHSREGVQAAASVVEETIVRMLCLRLAKAKVKLSSAHLGEWKNVAFVDLIVKLKEAYLAGKAVPQGLQALQTMSEVSINGGEMSNGE